MARLVRPEPPTTSSISPSVATAREKSREESQAAKVYEKAKQSTKLNKNFLDNWDMVKLQAYTSSQVLHAFADTSPAIWRRRDSPMQSPPTKAIPEKNIWGRPVPVRALRSRLKSWWLLNLPKLMPPLGAGEWETLRNLATSSGASTLLQQPPRRPVAVPVTKEERSNISWEGWESYASMPVSRIEGERRRGFQQSATGLPYEPASAAPPFPKQLSSKNLRRLCGNVFQISSVIEEDTGIGKSYKSRVKWGTISPDLPVASQTSFFDVNEVGNPPKGRKANPKS